MERVLKKVPFLITLSLIIVCLSSGITVYGGDLPRLFLDEGEQQGSWTNVVNKLVYTPGLGGYNAKEDDLIGPPADSFFGGYYYFRHSDGTRELGEAEVKRDVYFDASQKQLAESNQLDFDFYMSYRGAYDDPDKFKYRLRWIKNSGARVDMYTSGLLYTNGDFWRETSVEGKHVPTDAKGVELYIWAERHGNGNMNVYLDTFRMFLSDSNYPVMTGATVTGISDKDGAAVPIKKDINGNFLENWVNSEDTISGSITFSEPVKQYSPALALRLNVLDSEAKEHKGTMNTITSSLKTQNFTIPPGAYMMKAGITDNRIKFYYDSNTSFGPFNGNVTDLAGNIGLKNITNYDLGNCNLKLDSGVPAIETPTNEYEVNAPGRADVDIVVNEQDGGKPQSELNLYYYWMYKDRNGVEKKLEFSKPVRSIATPVMVGENTTYRVTIDVPTEDAATYQDFLLYIKAEDVARNSSGEYKEYLVRQRDITPPDITWEKSIRDDGTEVDLEAAEDTAYARSREITVSASDDECGVAALYYLWSKEPLDISKESSITEEAVIRDGNVFTIARDEDDYPTEGQYYLSIKAMNATETVRVASKSFYFDKEAPRVSRFGEIPSMNPTLAQYQVSDINLQDKLLYTVAAYDGSTSSYEAVTEPDISGGLKDSEMWSAVEFDGEGGTERTAGITEFVSKIRQSGKYKLFTRFYDSMNNYTELVEEFEYDLVPPQFEETIADEPSTVKKEHEVLLKATDNLSGIGEVFYEWIDINNAELNFGDFAEIKDGWYSIKSNGYLNGQYYLNIKLKDKAGNAAEEVLFIEGRRAEFNFDNSAPTVQLVCDTEKAVRSISFKYSEPKDAYSGIETFKYKLSTLQEIKTSGWVEIENYEGGGEIVYSNGLDSEEEWFLSVILQDTLGNEEMIFWPEPFRIDVTNPEGKASFGSGYTNKLDVLLQMEVEELKSEEHGTFKVILSGDIAALEGAAISEAPASSWKDVPFENGVATYGWRLSDTVDGEQRVYVRFMDEAGNMSEIYEAMIILDKTAPTGEITYDITEPTTGNVTAAIKLADNYEASNVKVLNNNHEGSYIFNRNGEFEFVFIDEAGNKGRTTASVSNIDRDAPKATVISSPQRDTWTNESITATLELVDINGYSVLSEGGYTHTFEDNGEFVFRFKDALGNQGSIKAEVKNIDKEAPVGNIIYTYSDTAPVTVYLAVYEPVEVTNNDGSFRHVFYENGDFTFEFKDKAGNEGAATAVVNTITLEDNANVNYKDSGRLTNGNVDVEFTAFSGLSCITSPTVTEEVYGPYTYSFTENGDKPVSIRVLAGEEAGDVRTVVGSVYNIDRVLPQAEVYISTTELTNQNVKATLLPYDDRGKAITILNNNGESEHEFEGNGTFTFDFKDAAGNIGHKAITVSNIDKSKPVAGLRLFTDPDKEKSVFAEVYFIDEAEEIEILNNNGSKIYEFVENGVFTFRYADKAGNEGYTTAQVSSISDAVSAGTIEYYIDGKKIDDPNVGIINKNVTAELVLDKGYAIIYNGGSSTYTFEQNGEFTFVYEDSNKNRGFATAKVSIIDKEAPSLQILADIVRATNKDVTITVSYTDNKGIAEIQHNMEAENTTSEVGKLTYICKDNKTIQVTVVDTAGNATTKEFVVNYIDKVMPAGTITYTPDSSTNQNVRAILTINEPGAVLNNNGKSEYVFTENGSFTFEIEDNAGNRSSKTASVNWIDKLVPVLTMEYNNTSITNQPVKVTVRANEDIIAINNGGAVERTFYANGEFTFKVMDIVGNEASIKAEVGNIDTTQPQIMLNGSDYISIFQNEAYTEAGYSAADNIDGDLTAKVVVEGSVNPKVPGIYVVKYSISDAAGNSSEKSRIVKVIGPDELVLLLNSKPAEGERVIFDISDIKASCVGNEGSYMIKWAEGKRTQAYFKSEGNIVAASGIVKLEPGSWYTFFLQDRERKTKCIQVYINK